MYKYVIQEEKLNLKAYRGYKNSHEEKQNKSELKRKTKTV